jgi:hypothetical protein
MTHADQCADDLLFFFVELKHVVSFVLLLVRVYCIGIRLPRQQQGKLNQKSFLDSQIIMIAMNAHTARA